MAERITRKDLDRIAESVSDGLAADLSVSVQGRNGYIGLDLDRADVGTVEMLYAGTTREVYTYLQGMRRAHLLAENLQVSSRG